VLQRGPAYLTAEIAVAAILGLQGRGSLIDGEHLLACAKHFTGHGEPEDGTNIGPSNLSERILRETYMYPFEMAVKKGNVRLMEVSRSLLFLAVLVLH